MGDDKSTTTMAGRDRELLIPVADSNNDDDVSSKPSSSSSASSSHHTGREAFSKVVRSWASKKFMTGCVILFPIAITFYITWWFIHFVDGFFSPIYAQLGINIFDQNTQAFKEVAIISIHVLANTPLVHYFNCRLTSKRLFPSYRNP
ncbi:hypothetical protein GIB67_010961 [Kingdonia uniflora]|uniref:Uncharacterized protein n=1 Tax=Kingdonia uniflora TaxID=39325 RepID=A0A7J7LTD0_9MAGN|nr:hypothetical protein GIB67_010961 [Kingdonia uniflora]